MADVPLHVVSDNSSSERRITPSWSISQLKAKLEPVTGVPPSSQRLVLKAPGRDPIPVTAADEDAATLSHLPLVPYAELHVQDTRPPGARPNYTDTTGVDKYIMPEAEYEKKTDSVLAWKKAHKLGRFDPNAAAHAASKKAAIEAEVGERGIQTGKRCRVGSDDGKRGVVMYVGDVPEIPGEGVWVGVRLDEPVGKNDGSIGGQRYWGSQGDGSGMKHGVFVRPERVEMGDWPPIDDLEDMEEI